MDDWIVAPADALEEAHAVMLRPLEIRTRAEAFTQNLERSTFTRQMADCQENPDWSGVQDDPSFRVVIPCSGGMDSTTAWKMAHRGGFPCEPVFVDTGAPYAPVEYKTLIGLMGVGPKYISLPVVYTQRYQHVDVGRNGAILWCVAEWMREQGWWGEIWFGNTASWGDTPVVGGDKSHRFFLTFNQLLTLDGIDARVTNPVQGMTKEDLVRWWEGIGELDTLKATRSCYSTDEGQCGRCLSCFHKAIAFAACGYELEWNEGADFTDQAEAFLEVIKRDVPSFHQGRYQEALDALMSQ